MEPISLTKWLKIGVMFHIDLKKSPYEILFGRPYRLSQFKNQWEIDEEANLADYMRNMLGKQKQKQTDENSSVSQQKIQLVESGDWVLI